MLSIEEKEYFDKVVKSVLSDLDVRIPILPYAHETLEGKSKNAMGCAWSYDKNIVYQITIDEDYISSCYLHYLWKNNMGGSPQYLGSSLEEVLFHEIAHMVHWRHGKKHTELTQRLYLNYKNRSVA